MIMLRLLTGVLVASAGVLGKRARVVPRAPAPLWRPSAVPTSGVAVRPSGASHVATSSSAQQTARVAAAPVAQPAATSRGSRTWTAAENKLLEVLGSTRPAGGFAGAAPRSSESFGSATRSGDSEPSQVARQAGAASSMDLTGKIALVTGASRGIGAAIADKLVKAGATVVGTATSDSGAEAISARFEGDAKGEGMKLDVTDAGNIDEVIKAVTEKYGAPDILVNNAGITQDTLMLRMKEKQWDDVIDTNLNSVFKVSKAALRGMTKKRWGRIISISSVVGSMGNVGQANYAASKAGMEGFTRAFAREIGSRGITVNSVAPGFIATDMTEGLPDDWKAKLLESVPAGRLGQPEEIADAVLFLAGESGAYITGHTLHVNGGMYM